MSDPVDLLAVAAIQALKADAGVAALVGSRVYDEVPRDARDDASDAQAPFVYLGFVSGRGREAGCSPYYSVTLRFYAVSTAFGHREARQLGAAMRAALDRKALALADGHSHDRFVVVGFGDVTSSEKPSQHYVDFVTELFDGTPYPDPQ